VTILNKVWLLILEKHKFYLVYKWRLNLLGEKVAYESLSRFEVLICASDVKVDCSETLLPSHSDIDSLHISHFLAKH